MPEYWQDKVAIVTGGSRGLGLSIASAFAASGAKVVIAARDSDGLARAATELRARGADVLAVSADVTDDVQVARLIQQTIERYGRLDVLVNNAGRSSRGEIAATTPAEFYELLNLNFLGTVRCTRAALPYLLNAGGHIVNIASLSAKTASPWMGAYPASKYPVAAYSQQLRLELGPNGLHVLLVCPGPIRGGGAGRDASQAAGLPESARKPAGGAKLSTINPDYLAKKIVRSCERRKLELVMPARARLLFAVSQLFPRTGDWILRKMT